MITNDDSGATARLAGSPQTATRLKCCMANGPVAIPATKLAPTLTASQPLAVAWKARIGQGTGDLAHRARPGLG